MNEILYYIKQMLPYMLFVAPLIFLFRLLAVRAMHKKSIRTTVLHEAGVAVFLLFAVGLASQTIIPQINLENGLNVEMGLGLSEISLRPMRIFSLMMNYPSFDSRLSFFLINILGNIVMFMPIGLFPPLLWRKITFPKAILIGFSSSLLIELCQIFEPRVCDIDDLWMNTLGAVLGFLVYLLLKKLFSGFTSRFKTVKTS